MALTLAIVNQKGGCGKTTTAVNLAAGLVLRGSRVLLIDLDPQANASISFGIDVEAAPVTVTELLTRRDLSAEYGLYRKGELHIIPSRPDLARLEHAAAPPAAEALRDWLAPLKPNYDFIVIDCPPSVGHLTGLALVAADRVLVPVDVGYFSLIGIKQLLAKLEEARRYNPEVDILGFLVTQYDPRNKLSHEVVEKLEESFPRRTFSTVIHTTVRLREAPGHHMTIFEYDGSGRAAESYQALTDEVLEWVRKRT